MNHDAVQIESLLKNAHESDTTKRKKQKDKVFSKGELADFEKEITKDWYIADLFDTTHLITCGVAKRPDYVEEGIPFLSAQNARPFKTNLNKIKYIDQETFEKITVGGKPEKNDVLYTRVGNCGEAAKIPYDFDFGVYVSLTLIKPVKCVLDSDYLVAFLNSMYGLVQAGQGAIGIGLKNLNVDNVRRYTIPLPPLAEQKEIARRLDDLLAQVDTLKTHLDNIPAILKRFRQSVLTTAVSGKLTEEWRKENECDEWTMIPFGELIEHGPQNGIYKPSKLYGAGTRIVRIDGFYEGEMCDWETIKRVELEEDEKLKWGIKLNDILINRVNSIEYLGKCGLVRTLPEDAVFESNIMRVTINESKALPEYIKSFLSSVIGLERLRSNAKLAVNQASINQNDVKSVLVNLPSLKEQAEIVCRVEQLFAFADKIEEKVNKAQARVDKLTQSILKKAFQGDLTAEWREQNPDLISGENSAEALLERIKAEREKLKPVKKTRRKSKLSSTDDSQLNLGI